MNTIVIFATTCHKYACFGGAHGDNYDLSDYADYNEFMDAFSTNNIDEKDPELDLLDVDDATSWPWLKINAHELPAVIEFLTLDNDERELVADYLETTEKKLALRRNCERHLKTPKNRTSGDINLLMILPGMRRKSGLRAQAYATRKSEEIFFSGSI